MNDAATLLKAYRLRDKRIAERLRFAATVLTAWDVSTFKECADDLERDLTPQEAATLLHLNPEDEK